MHNNQTIIIRERSRGCNHAFHFFMSLVTFGTWLPVWMIVAILKGGRR